MEVQRGDTTGELEDMMRLSDACNSELSLCEEEDGEGCESERGSQTGGPEKRFLRSRVRGVWSVFGDASGRDRSNGESEGDWEDGEEEGVEEA